MKWGLSVLDFAWHAIDEQACHQIGVYKAECGHLLMAATPLHDRLDGKPCDACAKLQLDHAEKKGGEHVP